MQFGNRVHDLIRTRRARQAPERWGRLDACPTRVRSA